MLREAYGEREAPLCCSSLYVRLSQWSASPESDRCAVKVAVVTARSSLQVFSPLPSLLLLRSNAAALVSRRVVREAT